MRVSMAALFLLVAFLECAAAFSSVSAEPRLLVGNTAGNNVVAFSQVTGASLGEFIPTQSSAPDGSECILDAPDTMVIGPDGMMYMSSGTTLDNSAVYKFDPASGDCLGVFATGGGMFRPYGIAFDPEGKYLYVSSFYSDQLLRYDGATGTFVDVFATGTIEPDGLNGPNILTFGPDGKLYVTTQGSYAVNGSLTYAFASQVLVYDVSDAESLSVFIDQPDVIPAPEGNGFISLLGIQFIPGCDEMCDLFVSDFAGGIRRYDSAGTLKTIYSTNYLGTEPAGNWVGSISLTSSGAMFSPAFNYTDNVGVVLRYDWESDALYPAPGMEHAIFVPRSSELDRPIGVLALP